MSSPVILYILYRTQLYWNFNIAQLHISLFYEMKLSALRNGRHLAEVHVACAATITVTIHGAMHICLCECWWHR